MFKTIKWQSMLIALVYIAGGVGMLFFTRKVEPILIDLIGIALIVIGVVHMIGYLVMDVKNAVYRNDFITAVVLMLVGGLIIYQKTTFRDMVPLILALMIIVSGFFKIQDGIDTQRMGYSFSAAYVLAIISLAVGAVIMFNLIKAPDTVMMVLGGGLLYSGVTDLFDSLYVSGKLRRYLKDLEEEDEPPVYTPAPAKKEEVYTPEPVSQEIHLEHTMHIPSYEDDPVDQNIELTASAEPAEAEEKPDVQ